MLGVTILLLSAILIFKFLLSICLIFGTVPAVCYYKLFTILSVDIEILTPRSSQVHPDAQPKGVQATGGC